jgi:hypothetical protein
MYVLEIRIIEMHAHHTSVLDYSYHMNAEVSKVWTSYRAHFRTRTLTLTID